MRWGNMPGWTYQRVRPGNIIRVTRDNFDAFFFDRTMALPAPADAAGYVYTVQLLVELEHRKFKRWLGLWFSKYRVTDNGLVDKDHFDDGMRCAVNLMDCIGLPNKDSVTVGSARMARRRMETLHEWQPTDEDMCALRGDLERRIGSRR
jgi:hypothetical protein